MYAFDAATGTKKWAHKITWSNSTPAVKDGKVYYGTSIPPVLVSVSADKGEEVFKKALPLMVFSSPAIADGKVYVGSFDGCLYEVDPQSGEICATFRTAASAANSPKFFKSDGSIDFGFLFRGDSFEEMFRSVGLFYEAGAILSSPTVSDGALLVGSCDGNLYCFR